MIKSRFDNYLQGAFASIGMHYRNLFELNYQEFEIGIFHSGLDETLSDSSGPYFSTAFGTIFTTQENRLKFGIEWTTLAIHVASTEENRVYVNANLPKLTLGTDF